jgi:hypothetical protein
MRSRLAILPFTILMICATGTVTAQLDPCSVGAGYESAPSKAGYRVASIRWDPLLHQCWAKLVSCSHPEQPAVEILMPLPEQHTAPATMPPTASLSPVVHAGDLVRLWSEDGNLLIETSGIAEASGATGSTIRVRLLHPNLEGQQQEQTLRGIVRGPRDVEMQR